jgi:hypothetical protein
MARKKQKEEHSDLQPSLFDLVIEDRRGTNDLVPGSFNLSFRLRNELSEGLKQSMLSRYEVAAKMSELLAVEITKSQLDSWTAESKEYHRFPAEYLPAFCAVTGYKEPLQIMARLVQCYLIESEEALLAELGRIDQVKRDLTKREKAVREYLTRVKLEG